MLRLRSGRLYEKFISETRLANAGAADRGRPVRYLTRRKRRVDIYATHFHRLQEPEHRRTAGAALQVNSHHRAALKRIRIRIVHSVRVKLHCM